LGHAAEIRVLISGGFAGAFSEMLPEFELVTGHRVIVTRGASMGTAATSIPSRLERGERADVLILVGDALDALVGRGFALEGSRVDLARSVIGMAVRSGAPIPDISTVDAFTRALTSAESIGYSTSASGVYISTVLFPRLGIAEQLAARSREIEGEPVASAVARGEVEIGFQQVSELLPVDGIAFVGPLPDELQVVTIFSAGIARDAIDLDAARSLIDYLKSPGAAEVIRRHALEPIE
jgi:molybdate transport system substrate-binding protein